MRAALALLPLLAGCATLPRDDLYFGHDDNPYWHLSIDGRRITMSIGHPGREQSTPVENFVFPRATAVRSGNRSVRTSTSLAGDTILIDAEFALPSSCSRDGPDAVRVVVNGREFRGCGGRQILVTAH